MTAKLVSTCNPNAEEGSKLTFVDSVYVVRRPGTSRIDVDVPDNVRREIPIVFRICGPAPHTRQPLVNRLREDAYQYFRSGPQD